MVAAPPSGPHPPSEISHAAVSLPLPASAPSPERGERGESAPLLDGRQIFFLFVGSALAACLIFALGVTVGRRIEQHAAAQKKAEPTDPLAVLDEIANAEEALTFHRAVLSSGGAEPNNRPPRYTLHSATFAQRPAAEVEQRRLREAGYKARILETPALPGGKPAFRLQIGEFQTVDGAQPVRAELLSRFGLATTVVKPPPAE
jgi:hypothetical protein